MGGWLILSLCCFWSTQLYWNAIKTTTPLKLTKLRWLTQESQSVESQKQWTIFNLNTMFLVRPQMFKPNMYLSSAYSVADFFCLFNDFEEYIASLAVPCFYT